MTQSALIKLTLLTLLLYFKCNNLNSESNQVYIDSIKQYQVFVDSLVNSYYSNPATALSHGIIHYSCPNGNNTYGGGGSADIYQDTKGSTTYQLAYIKVCDTVDTERTLYFIKNKIVLAIISDSGNKRRANYYRDDKYLSSDNSNSVTEKLAYKDLTEGYEVLKDFE